MHIGKSMRVDSVQGSENVASSLILPQLFYGSQLSPSFCNREQGKEPSQEVNNRSPWEKLLAEGIISSALRLGALNTKRANTYRCNWIEERIVLHCLTENYYLCLLPNAVSTTDSNCKHGGKNHNPLFPLQGNVLATLLRLFPSHFRTQ